jgi:quercetin dioxygenase-like cupin family protein
MTLRWLASAVFGGVSVAVLCSATLQVHANSSTPSGVTVKTLAQGQVKALPAGKVFVNILEFRQLPGADFGPHAHIPGIVYTLQGTSTISFRGAASLSVGPGDAMFIPAQAVHTHENLDGRVGGIAIAAGLIVVVILLCAATFMRGGFRRITIAALSLLLIGGGALPLVGATSNDYYLVAVRPDAQRALPMPRPDGRVAYSSPDVNPVPAAPYLERLNMITMPAGSRYVVPVAAGPQMLAVVQGNASVQLGADTQQVGTGDGAFAQMSDSLAISNPDNTGLRVLDFAVISVSAAPAAS